MYRVILLCSVAGLLMAAGLATVQAAPVKSHGVVGNDVSWPQCGHALPASHPFAVVGVTDGRASTTNPCVRQELRWAKRSPGTPTQPPASLYVNTENPGFLHVRTWPKSNLDPLTKRPVPDPYGTCRGKNTKACAWQYGWNMAHLDGRARGVKRPRKYSWWLDVETMNSWASRKPRNAADLEGMVAYFQQLGVKVGLYSTAYQWHVIAGTISPASSLYDLPEWVPGASTYAQATANCALTPFTGGGSVVMTQWWTSSSTIDWDVDCGTVKSHRSHSVLSDRSSLL